MVGVFWGELKTTLSMVLGMVPSVHELTLHLIGREVGEISKYINFFLPRVNFRSFFFGFHCENPRRFPRCFLGIRNTYPGNDYKGLQRYPTQTSKTSLQGKTNEISGVFAAGCQGRMGKASE